MNAARRSTDPHGDLLREMTRAIAEKTGTREEIARHYAEAAMHCLQDRKAANGCVYVGAPQRQHDVLQIRASLDRGDGIRKVCRDFGISRTKLFELFPGGIFGAPEGGASGVSGKVRTLEKIGS